MKTTIKIALFGAAGAVAAIALAEFSAQRLVTSRLTDRIEKATGLHAEFRSAKLNLLPTPGFTGEDLRLTNPADPSKEPFLKAEGVNFGFSLKNLLEGETALGEITLTRPVLRIVQGERSSASPQASSPESFTLQGLTVTDGTLIYQNPRRGVDSRLGAIGLHASSANGTFELVADVGSSLHMRAKAASVDDLFAGRPTGIEAELGAGGGALLPVNTKVRLDRTALRFDNLAGTLKGSSFKASGSFDWSDQPSFHTNISIDRVDARDLGGADESSDIQRSLDDLDDRKIDLKPLRLIDLVIGYSIDDLRAGPLHLEKIRGRTILDDGFLRIGLDNADLYRGKARGEVIVDGARNEPTQKARLELSGIDSAPFVADLSGFHGLAGKLQFGLEANSTGSSLRAMATNLNGTANLAFRDGAISGIDVPVLVRAIAAYLPSQWQTATDKIIVNSLTGTFRIAQGEAVTQDLHVVSPILDVIGKGKIDLVNCEFDLRFDPRLNTKPTRPGSTASALDLGASILIRGPWRDPQITADLSGLANDPAGTLDKLQTLGRDLFGQDPIGGLGGNDRTRPSGDDIIKGLEGLFGGFSEGRESSPMPKNIDGRQSGSRPAPTVPRDKRSLERNGSKREYSL